MGNLDQYDLKDFIGALLQAEAAAAGMHPTDVILGAEILARDGGADAITHPWITKAARSTSGFIPPGTAVWQLKAERRRPKKSQFRVEIDKPEVRKCLEASGTYVFLAQEPGAANEERATERDLREVALEKGYSQQQVRFFGRSRIAAVASKYPSLARLPIFGRELGALRAGVEWSAEKKHGHKFAEVAQRAEQLQLIGDWLLGQDDRHLRVLGPPGVGKTRLVLEALRKVCVLGFAVYAPGPGAVGLSHLLSTMRGNDKRCVLVIDECPGENLLQLLEGSRDMLSRIRLVTIGHAKSQAATSTGDGSPTLLVQPLDEGGLMSVLRESHPDLPEDRRTWVAQRTRGFVKLADILADAVRQSPGLTLRDVNAREILTTYLGQMVGQKDGRRLGLLKVMSLFTKVGVDTPFDGELDTVAGIVGLTPIEARETVHAAVQLNIVAEAGRRRYITPDLLAVWLAQSFFEAQGSTVATKLLSLPDPLRAAFLERTQLFEDIPQVREVATAILGKNGPFDLLNALADGIAARAFFSLGVLSPEAALDRVEGWLAVATLDELRGADGRRDLVWLLERLLYRAPFFERAFRALVRLAEAESEPGIGNNATGVVTSVFGVYLGTSALPFGERRRIFDDVLASASPAIRRLLVEGMGQALRADEASMSSPPDDGGKSLRWQPRDYPEERASRLAALEALQASLGDLEPVVRAQAATEIIDGFRHLVLRGLVAEALQALDEARRVGADLARIRTALEAAAAFEGPKIRPDDRERLLRALSELPTDPRSLLLMIVRSGDLGEIRSEAGLPKLPTVEELAALILASDQRNDLLALASTQHDGGQAGRLAAELGRRDGGENLGVFVAGARSSGDSWLASIYLGAAAADPQPYQTACAMTASGDPLEREVGARALTVATARPETIAVLEKGLRAGTIDPGWLRGVEFGRWTQPLSPADAATLVKALLVSGERGVSLALAASHRFINQGTPLDDDLLLDVCKRGLSLVGRHHDSWVWEKVASHVAERRPRELGLAIVETLEGAKRGVEGRDVRDILQKCAAGAPTEVASAVLDALTREKGRGRALIEAAGGWITTSVRNQDLVTWAARAGGIGQKALGRWLQPGPAAETVAALEHFGPESTFAQTLEGALSEGTFAGSPSRRYGDLASEVEGWLRDTGLPGSFRSWAQGVAKDLRESAKQWSLAEAER